MVGWHPFQPSARPCTNLNCCGRFPKSNILQRQPWFSHCPGMRSASLQRATVAVPVLLKSVIGLYSLQLQAPVLCISSTPFLIWCAWSVVGHAHTYIWPIVEVCRFMPSLDFWVLCYTLVLLQFIQFGHRYFWCSGLSWCPAFCDVSCDWLLGLVWFWMNLINPFFYFCLPLPSSIWWEKATQWAMLYTHWEVCDTSHLYLL